MNRRLVSIITPTYNVARYIPATIRSVLDQTYGHWEWIIVDDGSTDATLQAVLDIADPRVRLIDAPHSGLPAVVRNIGLRHAVGEYIAYIDADDIWLPDKLAAQLAYLEAHPSVGLVFCKYYLWIDDRARPRSIVPDTHDLPNPGMMLRALCIQNRIGTSGIMVRRALLEAYGGFEESPSQRGTEDYELCLRLASQTPFGFIDRPLYWYRIHGSNLSGNESLIAEGRILALEKAFQRNPELRMDTLLSGARMAARKLRWRGYGQLIDGAADCGRHAFTQSLRIWPFDWSVWAYLVLSCLGPHAIRQLRWLSRRVL